MISRRTNEVRVIVWTFSEINVFVMVLYKVNLENKNKQLFLIAYSIIVTLKFMLG